MLDSYIKELEEKQNTKTLDYLQEVPQVLIDLYKATAALNDFVTVKLRLPETKMYPRALLAVLTPVINGIANADDVLKQFRTSKPHRPTIPNGMSKFLARMNRVTVEVANATVYADKEERLSRRELMQIYHDSFPFAEFKQELEAHIPLVRAARLREKMSDDHTDGIAPEGRFAHQDGDAIVNARLMREAEQRRLNAGKTGLGKKIEGYHGAYSNLPTSLKGLPFKAFRMPIVPDFKDMGMQIDPQPKLKALGFKVTVLSDAFVVLEDQFLIAFDHKQLGIDSGVRKNKLGNFVVVKKSGPKEKIAADEATDKLTELLETINSKSHERYSLASTTFIPNPRNPKLWLAWVVRENQRKGIAMMTSTVEAGWGLPLNLADE